MYHFWIVLNDKRAIIAQLELSDNDRYGKRKQFSQERNQEAEKEQEKIVQKHPPEGGCFFGIAI